MKKIFILTGEPSGDKLASEVISQIKIKKADLEFLSVGGTNLEKLGIKSIYDQKEITYIAFTDILINFFKIKRKIKDTVTEVLKFNPDILFSVDSPDFTLRVAKLVKGKNPKIKIIHFIAPKVWAWNERRARTLATVADAVAAILPFEVDLLKEHGVNVEYVGHPLLDRATSIPSRDESFRAWGLDPERPLLGILPGSRIQEVERHLTPFVESARVVVDRRPGVQVLISQAPGLDDSYFRDLEFSVVRETPALLRWSDCVLTKSGTSSLETALEGTPLVVAHRVSWLSGVLARLLLRTRYIGLPNLVAHQQIVPEVLQGEVSPEVIAPLLLELIDESSSVRIGQIQNLDQMTRLLGQGGASSRVAEMAMTLLGRHS